MSPTEPLAAWIAIGLAAALVGWIWPFRRGFAGLVINAFAAVTGAAGVGAIGMATGLTHRPSSPLAFVASAIGALVLVACVHLVWDHVAHDRGRERKA